MAFIEFLKSIGLIFDPAVSPAFNSGNEPFYASFEGLGIGRFQVNPTAIPIGNGIRFYGLFITIGIILAFFYVAKWRAKDEGYHFDDILDLVLFVVPIGVVGARLFYMITAVDFDWSRWYAIWEGGLAIYGGIIAGILAIVGVAKYKKMRLLRLMDCVAPSVMMAQAIGRWGNFFNGEAFGAKVSDSFFLRMGLSHSAEGVQIFVHPTFLYESLWNILGFILINAFYKKKKFDGQIALEYIGWYGFGRFFIELLRQDSLPLRLGEYNLRVSSVIGLLCFIGCLTVFLIKIVKPRDPVLDKPCYYPGAKRLQKANAQALKQEETQPAADVQGENDGTFPLKTEENEPEQINDTAELETKNEESAAETEESEPAAQKEITEENTSEEENHGEDH